MNGLEYRTNISHVSGPAMGKTVPPDFPAIGEALGITLARPRLSARSSVVGESTSSL